MQTYDDVLIPEILSESLPKTFFITEIIEEYCLRDPISNVMDIDRWSGIDTRNTISIQFAESFLNQGQRKFIRIFLIIW